MIYKKREETVDLKILRALEHRMALSAEETNYLSNLEKGYQGERSFDSLTEKLTCDCLVLNDLLLKINGTIFQIDTLLITQNSITLYEVKNYSGEYIFQEESLKILGTKKEIMSPFIQLSRSKNLINQLLFDLGLNFSLQSYVVFLNKDFTLYQAPTNKELILPTMLSRHFEQVNKNSFSITSAHRELAKKLYEMHILESPYQNLPEYEFKKLRKGLYCSKCGSWIQLENNRLKFCQCNKCGHKELFSELIHRHVQDFQLLFPERKLRTSIIQEWCGFSFSRKRIYIFLQNNYNVKGKNRGTYYY